MTARRVDGPDARWVPEQVDVEILRLTAAGLTIEVVGRRLDLSERTVRRRLRALADEIGVDTSIEVVVHAVRAGVI